MTQVEKDHQNNKKPFTTIVGFQGPLPPPVILQQYDEVVPGSAKTIIKMAETQSKHRISLEQRVIKQEIKMNFIGQFLAFIIAVLVLLATCYLAITGHDAVAGILGGTTIVALVSAFVYGKNKMEKS